MLENTTLVDAEMNQCFNQYSFPFINHTSNILEKNTKKSFAISLNMMNIVSCGVLGVALELLLAAQMSTDQKASLIIVGALNYSLANFSVKYVPYSQ